jgi:endonuclease YncB( thermonuclease family)
MRMATIVIALFLVCSTATAKELVGKVIKVADGDTVTVLSDGEKHRTRLAGIDAPERKQRHGKASGAFLRTLTINRIVRRHVQQTRPLQAHCGRCVGCYARIDSAFPSRRLHVNHIVSWSESRGNALDNCRTAGQRCKLGKSRQCRSTGFSRPLSLRQSEYARSSSRASVRGLMMSNAS